MRHAITAIDAINAAGRRAWLRVQEIVISLPRPDSVQFITGTVGIWDNDRVTRTVYGDIGRIVTEFNLETAAQYVTITDPVTQQPVTISVAGIAMAIEQVYKEHWIPPYLEGRGRIAEDGKYVIDPE